MAERCGFKYQNRECHREVLREGKCIFHLDDPEKPIEPFIEEIKKQNASEDQKHIDLSHFVFPKTAFRYPRDITRPLLIEHCKFYGNVSLRA